MLRTTVNFIFAKGFGQFYSQMTTNNSDCCIDYSEKENEKELSNINFCASSFANLDDNTLMFTSVHKAENSINYAR